MSLSCIDYENVPGLRTFLSRDIEDYILTAENQTIGTRPGVLKSLSIVKSEIWIGLIFTFLLVAGILNLLTSRYEGTLKTVPCKCIKTCWIVLKISLLQFALKFYNLKTALVYLSYIFAVFQFNIFYRSLFSTDLILKTQEEKVEIVEDIIKHNLIPVLIIGESVTNKVLKPKTKSFENLNDYIKKIGVEKCTIKYQLEDMLQSILKADIYKTAIIGSQNLLETIFLNPTFDMFSKPSVPHLSKDPVSSCLHAAVIQTNSIGKRRKFFEM